MSIAREAKESFDQGRYSQTEKLYELILTKYPDNLYTLSNLGVVYFHEQKWQLAEESLKKAVAFAPNDVFSHCTLGIVYFQEERWGDANKEFNTALALNPKYPFPSGYLKAIKEITDGAKPTVPIPHLAPVGDFDTLHERLLRDPASPAYGEIGLSPSAF